MPLYLYRREDGTTFELRQKFTDAPLSVDPQTGQKVVRLIQPAPIIFKGSGFYVTDTKGATKATAPKADAKPAEGKADSSSAPASSSTPAAPATSAPASSSSAAD